MLALLMAAPAFATGSNSLFTQSDATEISNSGQAQIKFGLNNSVELYGFQATITLPDFLEIVDCALGERTDDSYSLTVNKVSATSAKIATVSLTPLNADTNATLFTLTVKAVREGSEQGAVNVTDIIFTNAEAQDVALDDFSAAVTLKPTLVSSITLNQSSAELDKGATLQLEATVSPENAGNKSITWSSDNEAVATVSDAGLVTAVGAGSATITATAADGSGVKATCTVTVIEEADYIPGDTNNDGVVTLSDVVNMINYTVGTATDEFNFDAADISGDGTVNVTDVVMGINLVLYAE